MYDANKRRHGDRPFLKRFRGLRDAEAARDQALADLHAAEERFRGAFERAPVGMALSDLSGRYLQVNDAMCQITGFGRRELMATSLETLMPADAVSGRDDSLAQLLSGQIDHHHRERRYLTANGEPAWISVHATVLRDHAGRPAQVLTQLIDVTERHELESQLRHLTDHDPLTGWLNRRGLEAELAEHVAHVNRNGPRGALLVLDLDHFKAVNDTLGHEAGDQLIAAVAARLTRRLGPRDVVARLGGDEFAILLRDAGPDSAQEIARGIVRDIRDRALILKGQALRHVTASIGITMFRQGLGSGQEILSDADLAMYDAKEAGRDRTSLYRPDGLDGRRMKARLAWVERIRDALDNDRLTLFAQPIVELSTRRVLQHELLLRMVGDDGDSIPPSAFLHIAERYDLIQELDRWVVTQAIRLIERQATHSLATGVEINVSGKSLGDEQLLELIEGELRRSRIDPSLLIFEVTETAAIANIRMARQFAERLTELGCHFALDDFGAGFGSFYYLKHIPFDYLKIDGEFVTGCLGNRTDRLVIESLVGIARGLGKQTIAEGVEDAATELFLSRNGVDFAQGFHVGEPHPVLTRASGPVATSFS